MPFYTANYKSPHKERAGASETEPPFSTKSTPPGARTRGEEKWSLLSALICNWVSCCNTSDGFEEVDCKHCVESPLRFVWLAFALLFPLLRWLWPRRDGAVEAER